jgi:hypothetical protein
MIRSRLKTPFILRLGMVCFLAGILIIRFVHPTATFTDFWVSLTSGILFGMSIGLNLLWVRLVSTRSRGEDGPCASR